MAGRGRRRTTLVLVVAGLALSGCGSTEPEPLEPVPPAVPADLCASIPEDARRDLTTSASTDAAPPQRTPSMWASRSAWTARMM